MAYINWSDNLSVKVKSFDDQHKILIGMINDFYENVNSKSTNEGISKLISSMKNYTITHFRNEENLMLRLSYPLYTEHKKEHDLFVSKVNDVEEKFKSGKLVISLEITGFLKDWLKDHIQVTDKKYSDFFISKGIL